MGIKIDVRKEYEILQRELGLDILICRAGRYIKCTCYNPLHKTGDPECRVCFGRGYASVIEQKNVIGIQPDRVRNDEYSITELGNVERVNMTYVFPHTMTPKIGDLVIVPFFNNEGLVTGIHDVYKITGARAINGDKGRVEVYNVKCKRDYTSSETLKSVVDNMSHSDRVKLKKGRRYICPILKLRT